MLEISVRTLRNKLREYNCEDASDPAIEAEDAVA